jgi:hypothetical protein
MAAKKDKAATDDDINKMFEGLGGEDLPPIASKGDPSKPKKLARTQTAEELEAELDVLAELENQVKPQADARPRTPRVATPVGGASSPTKRASVGSPLPQTSTRSSEDKPQSTRKSGDSTRSYHTSFTPSATSSELQDAEKKARIAEPAAQPAAASGGGWWGGILATASAAVKTAEAAVKEIQQNEEAKRWAEQVKGNVGALRGLGKTHHLQ